MAKHSPACYLEDMHTCSEWQKLGMQVKRGESSYLCTSQGAPVFCRHQVVPIDRPVSVDQMAIDLARATRRASMARDKIKVVYVNEDRHNDQPVELWLGNTLLLKLSPHHAYALKDALAQAIAYDDCPPKAEWEVI